MNAQLKSPFDGVVEQVKQSPQHLSVENARDLLEAIKKAYPKLIQPADGMDNATSPHDLLRKTIIGLGETIQKLNTAAVVGDGTQGSGMSAGDLSKLAAGQEKYIKILDRLSSTLSANDRQAALENAISEALDETDNKPLKELFLTKFRENLKQISRDSAKN